MMKAAKILGTGWLFTALSMTAQAKFLPDNNLHLEDSLNVIGGIDEDAFHEVMDAAEDFYGPIIKSHGGNLKFNRFWSNATVNASAQRIWTSWVVNMYGGLARRPEVSKDGFAMVVCHELGHHLAGYPFVSGWAANEGQSDYFASLSCAKELWKYDADGNAEAAETIPDYPKQLCDDTYFGEGQETLDLCYRQMLASHSLASLMGALGGTEVNYDTPDTSVVSKTDHAHPEGQCRMDTYMAGGICNRAFDFELIPANEKVAAANSCHGVNKDAVKSQRPRCWFKPGI